MMINEKQYVAIFSKDNAGGVRSLAPRIRRSGAYPLLITDQDQDLNSGLVEATFRVSWENKPSTIADQLIAWAQAMHFNIVGVVNLLDPLFAWSQCFEDRLQGRISSDSAFLDLADKSAVRNALCELCLSSVYNAKGKPSELSNQLKQFPYPVVIKPSRDSGGSLLVQKCANQIEAQNSLKNISEVLGEKPTIVEGYISGQEYSIDCIYVQGEIIPVFVVEKTGEKSMDMHDPNLLISRTISEDKNNVSSLIMDKLEILSRSIRLPDKWLHVEYRIDGRGVPEIIEINPRPGGGVYCDAIEYLYGVNPLDILIQIALGTDENAFAVFKRSSKNSVVGLLHREENIAGYYTVEPELFDELEALQWVIKSDILTPYQVQDSYRENIFIDIAFSGDTDEQVKDRSKYLESRIDKALRYHKEL